MKTWFIMIHQYDSFCSIGWRLKNEDRIADFIKFFVLFFERIIKEYRIWRENTMRINRINEIGQSWLECEVIV